MILLRGTDKDSRVRCKINRVYFLKKQKYIFIYKR